MKRQKIITKDISIGIKFNPMVGQKQLNEKERRRKELIHVLTDGKVDAWTLLYLIDKKEEPTNMLLIEVQVGHLTIIYFDRIEVL